MPRSAWRGSGPAPIRLRPSGYDRPLAGRLAPVSAHIRAMRTITQLPEILELPLQSIIVDDTDTPMQVIDPNLLGVLAGPDAGTFRVISAPDAIVLPASVSWEPVS